MQWLAQFFDSDQAKAHVDGYLAFPSAAWALTIPLPIKLPGGGGTSLQIDGMSVKLPKPHAGITRAYIFGAEEEFIGVALHGDRTVRFSEFNLAKELQEIHSSVTPLVREMETSK